MWLGSMELRFGCLSLFVACLLFAVCWLFALILEMQMWWVLKFKFELGGFFCWKSLPEFRAEQPIQRGRRLVANLRQWCNHSIHGCCAAFVRDDGGRFVWHKIEFAPNQNSSFQISECIQRSDSSRRCSIEHNWKSTRVSKLWKLKKLWCICKWKLPHSWCFHVHQSHQRLPPMSSFVCQTDHLADPNGASPIQASKPANSPSPFHQHTGVSNWPLAWPGMHSDDVGYIGRNHLSSPSESTIAHWYSCRTTYSCDLVPRCSQKNGRNGCSGRWWWIRILPERICRIYDQTR